MRSKKHAVIVSALICVIVGASCWRPPVPRIRGARVRAAVRRRRRSGDASAPRCRLARQTFTLELWFMRTGAGTVASTRHWRRLRSAAPHEGARRSRRHQRRHELLPRHRAHASACWSRTSRTTDRRRQPSGQSARRPSATTSGTTPPRRMTARRGGCTSTASSTRTLVVGAFTPRFDSIQHAALGTAMTSGGVPQGFFKGQMDEVRIWNTARDQAAIQAAMGGPVSTAREPHRTLGTRRGSRNDRGRTASRPAERHARARLAADAAGVDRRRIRLRVAAASAGQLRAAFHGGLPPVTTSRSARRRHARRVAVHRSKRWFRRDAAGVTTSTGTRRACHRDPARDEGPRRSRRLQRRHELLPRASAPPRPNPRASPPTSRKGPPARSPGDEPPDLRHDADRQRRLVSRRRHLQRRRTCSCI